MSAFERAFGRAAEASARAPGRVNIIGEHIDYNGGSVLPTPIPRHASIEIAIREDKEVRAASLNLGGSDPPRRYELRQERPTGGWIDYVQGTTRALAKLGYEMSGFDALLASTVPMGSGLASSAALVVALERALRRRFDLRLDDERIAEIAQQVENDFVGAHVGIMDPMVASLGREGSALLIDTKSGQHRYVPIPHTMDLIVVDSGLPHRHAEGEYNKRREECEEARKLLGAEYLCDLTSADLGRIGALPDPLRRRARHAVTENERVCHAVTALEGNRPEALGPLLDQSHRSLRDDYDVSTVEIDQLVQLLRSEPGVYGARMTGGGFGGSVVAVARAGYGRRAADLAVERYRSATGHGGAVVLPVLRGEPGSAVGVHVEREAW